MGFKGRPKELGIMSWVPLLQFSHLMNRLRLRKMSCAWVFVWLGLWGIARWIFVSTLFDSLPSNVDRPELCQITLYDFQKFLQYDQKVFAKRGALS